MPVDMTLEKLPARVLVVTDAPSAGTEAKRSNYGVIRTLRSELEKRHCRVEVVLVVPNGLFFERQNATLPTPRAADLLNLNRYPLIIIALSSKLLFGPIGREIFSMIEKACRKQTVVLSAGVVAGRKLVEELTGLGTNATLVKRPGVARLTHEGIGTILSLLP